MPKLVITHRVEDIAKWKSFDGERQTNMSAFASDIRSYASADGEKTVAVTMDVSDMEGLQTFLRSETCDSIMRRHGVIRPVATYLG
jgi:hypothetical protein